MLLKVNLSNLTAFLRLALAIFVILVGSIAALSVFANDLYFFGIFPTIYINLIFWALAFFLALSGVSWGLAACIFLLPICFGLSGQLNAYIGTQLLVLPNVGLDIVSGFCLGFFARFLLVGGLIKGLPARIKALELKKIAPWPVSLALMMITISTITAIARNLYQSAASTSLKGLLFNLVHFRPIDWRDAYLPISDWIAYVLAVMMIMLVIFHLQSSKDKNQKIFRPVVMGLLIAALMGITQSITGLGLPEAVMDFRKDQLGFAAIGFQPDLHAFAGHMILGAIGLWAYFKSGLTRSERIFLLFVIGLSWIGLILSKSRAILLFALMAMVVWLFVYLWTSHRKYFISLFLAISAALIIVATLIFNNALVVANITGLSWIADLALDLKTRNLFSWSELGGILGSRLEIWGAAWSMFWQFPLAGLGQGNFYHLSSVGFFSKSQYLILNGGENAHNYFLQTLTETGLVGAILLIGALIYPYQNVAKRSVLLPAGMALGSLFLGNIFSHSFLVRENLILGAVFVGLLYSQSIAARIESPPSLRASKLSRNTLILILLSVGLAYFYEIEKSFGKPPFTDGFYCYQKVPLTSDGWTKGVFEAPIPRGSKGVELVLEIPQFKNSEHPINLSLELRHVRRNQYGYNDTINSITKVVSMNKKNDNSIVIAFSDQDTPNMSDNVELEGRLSGCYSPRNLGDSVDSRLLGIQIKSIKAF